jgi:microcystin-dependent protein
MTAIDFPDEPEVNDSFTAGGRTWTWDGSVWNSTAQPVEAHAGTHTVGGGDDLSGLSISQISGLSSALAAAEPPTGTVAMWITTTSPSGWLICDGSPVSRSTFSGLFDIIGTSFGVGDGSTTFNLPNLRGKTAVGLDVSQTEFDSVGKTGGNKTVTLNVEQIPSHSHTGNTSNTGAHTHSGNTSNTGAHAHSGATAGAGASTSNTGDHTHSVASRLTGFSTAGRASGNLTTVTGATSSTAGTGTAGAHSHNVNSHAHNFDTSNTGNHSHSFNTNENGGHSHSFTTDNSGSSNAHNNLQPYLVLEYIIKAT